MDLTLAIDEKLLARARALAGERGTDAGDLDGRRF